MKQNAPKMKHRRFAELTFSAPLSLLAVLLASPAVQGAQPSGAATDAGAFSASSVLSAEASGAERLAPSALDKAPATRAPAQENSPALSLAEAVALAVAKGHLVRIEALKVPLAKASLLESWGQFDPQLTAGYSEGLDEKPLTPFLNAGAPRSFTAERTANSSLGLSGLLPSGTSYRFGANAWKLRNEGPASYSTDGTTAWAGFSVTQPLLRDSGLTTFTRVRVARTNLALSEWEFRASLEQTVLRVIDACAQLELAEARLRIARKSLAMAEQLRAENTRRQEVGSMSEYDVLSADARVASREETALQAERGLDYARNTLRSLISDTKGEALTRLPLSLKPLPLPRLEVKELAGVLQNALLQRPDYRSAELYCRRGQQEKSEALNQLLPRVDLSGSYGYNALAEEVAGARRDLRTREHKAWTAGVSVSIPLGSFAERGKYRSARLRLQQAQLRLEKLEQDIALEIANAAEQYTNAQKRMASAGRARALNQRALEAEFKKLRAGTGSTFSVLYQQDQLNYAELNELYARVDLIRAGADYERAQGLTLSTYHIEPLR